MQWRSFHRNKEPLENLAAAMAESSSFLEAHSKTTLLHPYLASPVLSLSLCPAFPVHPSPSPSHLLHLSSGKNQGQTCDIQNHLPYPHHPSHHSVKEDPCPETFSVTVLRPASSI